MSSGRITHGGGPVDSSAVSDDGSTLVLKANRLRKYAILVAARENAGPIFLKLTSQNPIEEQVAEFGKGIPLYPGDAYELIEHTNLFVGNILAVKGPGTGDHTLYTQDGF